MFLQYKHPKPLAANKAVSFFKRLELHRLMYDLIHSSLMYLRSLIDLDQNIRGLLTTDLKKAVVKSACVLIRILWIFRSRKIHLFIYQDPFLSHFVFLFELSKFSLIWSRVPGLKNTKKISYEKVKIWTNWKSHLSDYLSKIVNWRKSENFFILHWPKRSLGRAALNTILCSKNYIDYWN